MSTQPSLQSQIQQAIGVNPNINTDEEIRSEIAYRIGFIQGILLNSGCKTLVLGISGGVDSTTTGRLCQLAINELKARGHDVEFIAVRLPYKTQADESDAQAAVAFIQPDRVITINIENATDGLMNSLPVTAKSMSEGLTDFVKGNVKSRQRMVAQYAIANYTNGLVVGTDNAVESLTGFFCKHGDGGVDFMPIAGLTKGQVRLIAKHLGAPNNLVDKAPTADLEDLDPGKLDEVAIGATYEELDNYLLGKPVSERAKILIESTYLKTQHKRELPYAPPPQLRCKVDPEFS